MCLIHPPSQSSSICWLCHSVFVIWLPPLFPSPLLRPPGGADIELVYMIDLPLFENDPSLRCRSDSLFCAVTALWLMTHHLMCLNLLVVLWCLCWFWMCGPPLAHDWIHLLHSIYCFLSDIPCTLIGVAPVLGPPIQRRQFGGLEMTNVWPALQSGRLMSSACQLAAVPLVVMPDCCVN